MSLTTSLGRKSWPTQVKGKYEDRARREGQSRRDISEKEKERMSRYDDKNRYDERTRRDSSEKEKVKQDSGPRSKEREQPQPDGKIRQDSSDKERTSRSERRMTSDKFRLTRTPSDAIRMISDAISVCGLQ